MHVNFSCRHELNIEQIYIWRRSLLLWGNFLCFMLMIVRLKEQKISHESLLYHLHTIKFNASISFFHQRPSIISHPGVRRFILLSIHCRISCEFFPCWILGMNLKADFIQGFKNILYNIIMFTIRSQGTYTRIMFWMNENSRINHFHYDNLMQKYTYID